MRTFIALDLPVAFADETRALMRALRPLVGGRPTPPWNLHLTLAFLGEVGEDEARSAIAAMEEAAADVAPVPLRPVGLGGFGRGRQRTLFLDIAADPKLCSLAAELRDRLAGADVPFDPHAFRPHVTLFRKASLPAGHLPDLPFPDVDTASSVTLYRSTLTPDGPLYKPLHSVVLA